MTETTMTTQRADELPERWSAQRKMEIVLRLVRGEAIDEVAREVQVPVHELEEWRRVFLESGQQGLKRLGRPKVSPKVEAAIRTHLKAGNGILKVAKMVGCGSGTVQRVKKEMAGQLVEDA